MAKTAALMIAAAAACALTVGIAGADDTSGPSRAELEQKFAATLRGAVLSGKWRLLQDGKIGDERPEEYRIESAEKVEGDTWKITARVRYAEHDLRAPLHVKVHWAGDTPIISVTDLKFFGFGPYTARVMVYRDLYSGTWFGPGHGGLMQGKVTREAAGDTAPAASDQ